MLAICDCVGPYETVWPQSPSSEYSIFCYKSVTMYKIILKVFNISKQIRDVNILYCGYVDKEHIIVILYSILASQMAAQMNRWFHSEVCIRQFLTVPYGLPFYGKSIVRSHSCHSGRVMVDADRLDSGGQRTWSRADFLDVLNLDSRGKRTNVTIEWPNPKKILMKNAWLFKARQRSPELNEGIIKVYRQELLF